MVALVAAGGIPFQTLGDDRSDLSENCRATCESSLPDPEIKARVWAEVTDPSNTDSLYKRRAKIEGFYAFSQFDIVEPYFDKFFDVLPMVYEKMTHKNFEGFFYGFLPRMEVKDEHIVRLMMLLQNAPDTEQMYADTLKDGIDLMLRSK